MARYFTPILDVDQLPNVEEILVRFLSGNHRHIILYAYDGN